MYHVQAAAAQRLQSRRRAMALHWSANIPLSKPTEQHDRCFRRVAAIAVDQTTPHLLAGAAGGGIWERSTLAPIDLPKHQLRLRWRDRVDRSNRKCLCRRWRALGYAVLGAGVSSQRRRCNLEPAGPSAVLRDWHDLSLICGPDCALCRDHGRFFSPPMAGTWTKRAVENAGT